MVHQIITYGGIITLSTFLEDTHNGHRIISYICWRVDHKWDRLLITNQHHDVSCDIGLITWHDLLSSLYKGSLYQIRLLPTQNKDFLIISVYNISIVSVFLSSNFNLPLEELKHGVAVKFKVWCRCSFYLVHWMQNHITTIRVQNIL